MVLPTISREGMIEVDRIMTKDFKIPVELMMEHAGLNLARHVAELCQNEDYETVVIIAGNGNNGGGGLVAARRLRSWGLNPYLWLPKGQPARETPKDQYTRLTSIGIEELDRDRVKDSVLVVDAYIGYNFRGEVREEDEPVFDLMRKSDTISLDIPSGIDSNLGRDEGKIAPIATLTLAWPKTSMSLLGRNHFGSTYLVDISIPLDVFREHSVLDSIADPDELGRIANYFRSDPVIPIELLQDGWQPAQI